MIAITDAEIKAVAQAICCPKGCVLADCLVNPTDDEEIANARAAILASRAALAEAGFKIVAREPTEEMLAAAAPQRHLARTIWLIEWAAAP